MFKTCLTLRLESTLHAVAVFFLLSIIAGHYTVAQSKPAAYGPGSYAQIGGTGSIFQADYGQRNLGGSALFIDAHLYRRIGVEAEVRTLNLNQDSGTHENTYLVGPRYSFLAYRLRPYTKILVGRGDFYFPFHYATGSYFVIAPGCGVDWQVGKSRMAIRLVDIEFQKWPWFTYGPLKPYGVSSGIAVRIF